MPQRSMSAKRCCMAVLEHSWLQYRQRVRKCREQHGQNKSVDVDESMWSLDEDWDGSTDATHSLMISLARPAITAEEITWKKGNHKGCQMRLWGLHMNFQAVL